MEKCFHVFVLQGCFFKKGTYTIPSTYRDWKETCGLVGLEPCAKLPDPKHTSREPWTEQSRPGLSAGRAVLTATMPLRQRRPSPAGSRENRRHTGNDEDEMRCGKHLVQCPAFRRESINNKRSFNPWLNEWIPGRNIVYRYSSIPTMLTTSFTAVIPRPLACHGPIKPPKIFWRLTDLPCGFLTY